MVLTRTAYCSFGRSHRVVTAMDCLGFGVNHQCPVQFSLAARTNDVNFPDHSPDR